MTRSSCLHKHQTIPIYIPYRNDGVFRWKEARVEREQVRHCRARQSSSQWLHLVWWLDSKVRKGSSSSGTRQHHCWIACSKGVVASPVIRRTLGAFSFFFFLLLFNPPFRFHFTGILNFPPNNNNILISLLLGLLETHLDGYYTASH